MPERKLLEKDRRRAVQERAAQTLRASNDIDESALVQRLEHAPHAHAANLLDLRAADRLAIRDDRERLERCGRQALRARRQLRALDRLRVFGAREDLPSPAHFHELDAVAL